MTVYRFYRIVSSLGPEEYIGSTRQSLAKRWSDHRTTYINGYSHCSSKKLFTLYGVENCSIVLIHEMECETVQHALKEERRILEERRDNALNKTRPYITEEERKEHKQAYYQDKREDLKEYYRENRDRIKTRCLNRYYEKKEAIREKNHSTVQCPSCNTSIKYMRLSVHRKTCVPKPLEAQTQTQEAMG
jgi:hypothetical protein